MWRADCYFLFLSLGLYVAQAAATRDDALRNQSVASSISYPHQSPSVVPSVVMEILSVLEHSTPSPIPSSPISGSSNITLPFHSPVSTRSPVGSATHTPFQPLSNMTPPYTNSTSDQSQGAVSSTNAILFTASRPSHYVKTTSILTTSSFSITNSTTSTSHTLATTTSPTSTSLQSTSTSSTPPQTSVPTSFFSSPQAAREDLSHAQLAGAISGSIVGAAVALVALIYLILRRRKKRIEMQEHRIEEESWFQRGQRRIEAGQIRLDSGGGAGRGIQVRPVGRVGGGMVGGVGGGAVAAGLTKNKNGNKRGAGRKMGIGRGKGKEKGKGRSVESAWLYDPPMNPESSVPRDGAGIPVSPTVLVSPIAPMTAYTALSDTGNDRLRSEKGRARRASRGVVPLSRVCEEEGNPFEVFDSTGSGEEGTSVVSPLIMRDGSSPEGYRSGEVPRPRSGTFELE